MLMGNVRGMDQAAICRGRAEEADREAQKAHDPEMKRMYEDIAAAWRKLATLHRDHEAGQNKSARGLISGSIKMAPTTPVCRGHLSRCQRERITNAPAAKKTRYARLHYAHADTPRARHWPRQVQGAINNLAEAMLGERDLQPLRSWQSYAVRAATF